MPTNRQPVCSRWRYQAISSGRLPDQMIRYCENEKYAHSITNASIRLPRSWKCAGDDDAVERRPAAEPDEHDDEERQRRQALAAHDQHAVDRREPVRLERHQPVERRERDRQAVGEQAAAAQHLHPPRDARIAGAILLERPRVQEVRRARSRRRSRTPRGPGRTACSGRAACRADTSSCATTSASRPLVQVAHAEARSAETEAVSTGSTRDAAPIGRRMTHAPGAARQLMDHAEREASERHAEARTCTPSGTTGRTASGS